MSDWIVSSPARLDQFLTQEAQFSSRVKAQEAIDANRVQVNDQPVDKASYRLQEGDHVRLEEAGATNIDKRFEPKDLHLDILYEDPACLVINKPAGIAVHPGAGMLPGEVTMIHGIAFLFSERGIPFSPEGVLAHRLDRETTGCLLVAKTPDIHSALQEQFATRTTTKTYLAIVAGVPSPASAVIDAPVGRSATDRTKMAVIGSVAARDARTTYRTLSTSSHAALLACDLHTGRTHQLRVHLQAIGYPILGDPTYASSLSERIADENGIQHLCLHAWKLSFHSPADEREKSVTAPLPPPFEEVLQKLEMHVPA